MANDSRIEKIFQASIDLKVTDRATKVLNKIEERAERVAKKLQNLSFEVGKDKSIDIPINFTYDVNDLIYDVNRSLKSAFNAGKVIRVPVQLDVPDELALAESINISGLRQSLELEQDRYNVLREQNQELERQERQARRLSDIREFELELTRRLGEEGIKFGAQRGLTQNMEKARRVFTQELEKSLTSFESAGEIIGSLERVGDLMGVEFKTMLNVVTKYSEDIEKQFVETNEGMYESANWLYRQLVGGSIIPDMWNDIVKVTKNKSEEVLKINEHNNKALLDDFAQTADVLLRKLKFDVGIDPQTINKATENMEQLRTLSKTLLDTSSVAEYVAVIHKITIALSEMRAEFEKVADTSEIADIMKNLVTQTEAAFSDLSVVELLPYEDIVKRTRKFYDVMIGNSIISEGNDAIRQDFARTSNEIRQEVEEQFAAAEVIGRASERLTDLTKEDLNELQQLWIDYAAGARSELTKAAQVLPKQSKEFKALSKNIQLLDSTASSAFKRISKEVQNTTPDVEKMTEEMTKFDESLEGLNRIRTTVAQTEMDELTKRMEIMQEKADLTATANSFVNFGTKVGDALDEGIVPSFLLMQNAARDAAFTLNDLATGSLVTRLSAVRNQLFGAADSSNVLAKSLDFMINAFYDEEEAMKTANAGVLVLTENMSKHSVALHEYIKDFANAAKVSDVVKTEYSELGRATSRLATEWKLLTANVKSGSDNYAQRLATVREQLRLVQTRLEAIRERNEAGGALIPDEQVVALQNFENMLMQSERQLVLVTQRMREARDSSEQFKYSIWDTAGIFERFVFVIKNSLRLLTGTLSVGFAAITGIVANSAAGIGKRFIDGFRGAEKSTEKMTESVSKNMKEMRADMVKEATRATGTVTNRFDDMAEEIVLGSIVPDMVRAVTWWFEKMYQGIRNIGNKLFQVITSPFRMAQNAIRGILWQIRFSLLDNFFDDIFFYIQNLVRETAREFVSINKNMEAWQATLSGMLTGLDVEIPQDSIDGFFEYLQGVAKRTPFELEEVFSQALRLTTFNFDVREWFEPIANAAAAVDKPMDQLVNALAKLTVGEKGDAIRMLRDFGINAREAAAWIDTATGKAVSFEEALAAENGEVDAIAEGWRKVGLQFSDANGELLTGTEEALEILRGYVSQESRFAKAAEARALTLDGIINNIGDTVTELYIALGAPIFERLTEIFSEILQDAEDIQEEMLVWLSILGDDLAVILEDLWEQFKFIFLNSGELTAGLKEFVAVVHNIAKGDWENAWNIIQEVVYSAINVVVDYMGDFLVAAVRWGAEFISQIAYGIIDAAATTLLDAVEFATDIIASMLMPGSPPDEGPLSDIDTWGKGLMETFYGSFDEADVGILENLGDKLKGIFTVGGEFNLEGFKDTQANLAKFIDQINKTGSYDEAQFSELVNQLGIAGTALEDYLRSRLNLAEVEKEYQDAEEAGFVPKELKEKLKHAKVMNKLAEVNLQLEEEKNKEASKSGAANKSASRDFKKTYEEELDLLEKKRKIGLIDEEEYLQGRVRLEERYVEEALKAGEDAGELKGRVARIQEMENKLEKIREEARKKSKQNYKKQYAEELELLRWKFDQGLISEEEYVNGLLSAEQRYVDASRKDGIVAGLDSHIQKIKELKDELDLLTGSGLDTSVAADFGRALELLEDRYRLGLVTEKGYTTEKIKIHESYIDDVLKMYHDQPKEFAEQFGEGFNIDEFVKTNQGIILDLEEAIKGMDVPETSRAFLTEMFGDLGEQGTEAREEMEGRINEVLTGLDTEMGGRVNEIKDELSQTWANLQADLSGAFSGAFTEAFAPITDRFEAIFGEGGKIAQIFGGFGDQIGILVDQLKVFGGVVDSQGKGWFESFKEFFFGGDTEPSGLSVVWGNFVDSVKAWLLGGGVAFLAWFPFLWRSIQPIIAAFVDLEALLLKAWYVFEGLVGKPVVNFILRMAELGRIILRGPLAALTQFIDYLTLTFWPEFTRILGNIGRGIRGVFTAGTIIFTLFTIGISKNIDQLAEMFDGLWDTVSEIFSNIASLLGVGEGGGAGGGFFSALLAPFVALWNAISALFAGLDTVIFTPIGNFFKGLFDIIYGSILQVLGIVQAFIGIGALLKGDWELAKEAFGDAWETYSDGLSNVLAGIPEIMGSIVDAVPTAILGVLETIASMLGLENVAEWLAGLREGISGSILGFFQTFGDELRVWVDDYFDLEFFNTVFTELSNFFTGLAEDTGLTELFTKLGTEIIPRLSEAFERLRDALADLGGRLGDIITPAFEKLGEVLEPIWDFLVELGKTLLENEVIWNSLVVTLKVVASIIGVVLGGALAGLVGLVTGLAYAVEQFVLGLTRFVEGLVGVFTGMVTSLEGAVMVIQGIFTGDFELIKQGFQTWADGVAQIFQGLWDMAVGLFQTSLGTIFGFIKGFVTGVIETFQALYDALVGESIIPDMVNEILSWGDILITSFTEKINTFKDLAVGIFTDIAVAAAGALETVTSTVTDTAKTATDNLPDWVQRWIPSHESGAWDIPRNTLAYLHKGEMVVPANIADVLRQGPRSSRMAQFGSYGSINNSSTAQYNFGPGSFSGAFPNIKSGKDGKQLINTLDQYVKTAELRGRT